MLHVETPTVDAALVQLSAAFGQGLGGIRIPQRVAQLWLAKFRPILERGLDEWDVRELDLTDFALKLGQLTRQQIVDRQVVGAPIITEVSVRDVLLAVTHLETTRDCPFEHHHATA